MYETVTVANNNNKYRHHVPVKKIMFNPFNAHWLPL
jgi:hypothetical protein